MLDGIKVDGRLLSWDLYDRTLIIGTILMLAILLHATIALGMTSIVICPDHGVKAVYTGNRKFAQKKMYCEYSHATRLSTHKFWQECD